MVILNGSKLKAATRRGVKLQWLKSVSVNEMLNWRPYYLKLLIDVFFLEELEASKMVWLKDLYRRL